MNAIQEKRTVAAIVRCENGLWNNRSLRTAAAVCALGMLL